MGRKLVVLVLGLLLSFIYFSCGTTKYVLYPNESIVTVVSSKSINAATGGEVSANVQGVSVNVSIPAGALNSSTTITIATVDNPPSIQGFSNGGVFLDFGPSGLTFTTPVTVTVNYDINDYPLGIDESTIKLYTYENNNWVAVPVQTTNTIGDYIVAQLSHFSYYAPMSGSGNYTLQINISPSNGGFVSPSVSTYAQNTTATIYASPQSGYMFSGWTGAISSSANPLYLFMNSNKSITAAFSIIVPTSNPNITPNFSLLTSVSPLNSGIVSPSSGSYPQNTLLSVSAVANSGYEFSYWIGDVTNTLNATTTILMDVTKNIQAIFSAIPTSNPQTSYPLFLNIVPTGSGVVTPSAGIYTAGTTLNLQAFGQNGFTFSFWSGSVPTSNSNPLTVIMDSTKNITVNFQ